MFGWYVPGSQGVGWSQGEKKGAGASMGTPPLSGTNSEESYNSKSQSSLPGHEIGTLVKVK